MVKLEHVPNGLDEIKEYYGPDGMDDAMIYNPWYWGTLVSRVVLHQPMKLSWDNAETTAFYAHRIVVPSLSDALLEIQARIEEYAEYLNLTLTFGGCYCPRLKTDKSGPSTHAWAIAVDLCPELGRYGNKEDAATYPRVIIEAFEKRGWIWGGRWTVPDAMHFQAAKGY